jgi:hypothetical protein
VYNDDQMTTGIRSVGLSDWIVKLLEFRNGPGVGTSADQNEGQPKRV